ncbi:hypothetical protein ACFXHA_25770 [Nocardia sp. NPDC059240]
MFISPIASTGSGAALGSLLALLLGPFVCAPAAGASCATILGNMTGSAG